MKRVAIIGGGPAGLIAAETLAAGGCAVTVYERMPTVARKLLIAGRGGLNLTHSEDFERFVGRYGPAAGRLRPMLEALPPTALITWADGLGAQTFIGSSGRVFPKALKASPLLRAWLARLEALGVTIRTRHEWLGWRNGALAFRTPEAEVADHPDAAILALGGASWSRLGSNGAWADLLRATGVPVHPFRPANSGFDVGWSAVFRDRFAGQPLKNIAVSFDGRTARGDAMITGYGLEGGVIYALSAALRDAVERGGAAIAVDLRPDLSPEQIATRLARARLGDSTSNVLRKAVGLSLIEIGLLREAHGRELRPGAAQIKAAPLTLTGVQGLERAISSAGGIDLAAVDEGLMLTALPGVFAAGEMLDWEAPTGGYLLQASFASGVMAARSALAFLNA